MNPAPSPRSYPFIYITCQVVLIGTGVWDPESKRFIVIPPVWSDEPAHITSLHIVYCYMTNCLNIQWLKTITVLLYFVIFVGQKFSWTWMDMSSISCYVSRSHSLLFRWWMSWYGESRMAPLTYLVPWQGWLEVQAFLVCHLEYLYVVSPAQHEINVVGLTWCLRGPRGSIPGVPGRGPKVS